MSLVSKYHISISDALVFVGAVVLGGVLVFSDAGHRIPGFIGGVMLAGGYLWERFFVQRVG